MLDEILKLTGNFNIQNDRGAIDICFYRDRRRMENQRSREILPFEKMRGEDNNE